MTQSPPPWLAPWRTAFHKNKDRFVQVATVSAEGLPEVRTVVLRGLAEETGLPYFFSDTRSAKYRALSAGSQMSLHTWWKPTSEQFRLRGEVESVQREDHPWGQRRQELWWSQGEENRRLFLRQPPGTPVDKTPTDVEDQTKPPEHFALMILNPLHVDYLKLGDPQERFIWGLEGGEWQGGQVVP